MRKAAIYKVINSLLDLAVLVSYEEQDKLYRIVKELKQLAEGTQKCEKVYDPFDIRGYYVN